MELNYNNKILLFTNFHSTDHGLHWRYNKRLVKCYQLEENMNSWMYNEFNTNNEHLKFLNTPLSSPHFEDPETISWIYFNSPLFEFRPQGSTIFFHGGVPLFGRNWNVCYLVKLRLMKTQNFDMSSGSAMKTTLGPLNSNIL